MSRNIFFLLYCVEKTNDGKWPFFDKNHGLTPLENFDFFDFFHVHKTFFCIQNITKQSFLSYFAEKNTVLPSPLPRRFVVGPRFSFLHHWKVLEPPEQMFEGSFCLRKNESKGTWADPGGGCRGCAPPPPPEMTCGFLINTVQSASQLYKICFIIWYVFSAVHIMLLPSRKPSSSYSLLKFVYVTSQLRHSLVVHPPPMKNPWSASEEGNMGGKHSMGWDGSILFSFPWGRGGATFLRYVWGGLAFDTLLYTNFKHFTTHLYILQLQLVKSHPL